MEHRILLTVFITVFLAEMGDKTQLATFLYAYNKDNPKLIVFIGSSLALIFASGIGVFAGSMVSQYMNAKYLSWLAGAAFIFVDLEYHQGMKGFFTNLP